jgi:hypothetical protein
MLLKIFENRIYSTRLMNEIKGFIEEMLQNRN